MPARRVGFGNNKGGTGKSSSVMGLAGALAQRGQKVLVVDLDPQANLSRRMGFSEETPGAEKQPTISEAIKADADGCIADTIIGCAWDHQSAENIDLVPSRLDLENRVFEAGQVGALRRLQRSLIGVDDEYDWTLFDFPPSLGHLTQMGMVAAGRIVLALVPEYDPVKGALRVRDFVAKNRQNLGCPELKIEGIIVNLVRSTSLHKFHLEGLEESFSSGPEPVPVWQPYLPLRVAVAESNDAAIPMYAYPGEPAKELASSYDELATQLEKLA